MLAVRLPDLLEERLSHLAKQTHRSKSYYVKQAIQDFLDEQEEGKSEHKTTQFEQDEDLVKQLKEVGALFVRVHGMKVGKEDFALRPMTCPFQFVLYKRKPRSYKDLPLKYAEIASLFRNEQSGELRGLTRVRQFTLADAHIICTPGRGAVGNKCCR